MTAPGVLPGAEHSTTKEQVMKQWFGGNDAYTSPSYFAADGRTVDHERFPLLVALLRQLAEDRYSVEGYASPWVELIYLDDESPRKVIAYRHTSDISYRVWHPRLLELAGSFARGSWGPFRDRYQYKTLLAQGEAAGAADRA
jgi:hypothetical protein